MIRIPCPYCGPRNSSEFRYVGESAPRPDPGAVSIEAWREYLYTRANPLGWVSETWYHGSGCRSYLRVRRNTASNAITDVTALRSAGPAAPEVPPGPPEARP